MSRKAELVNETNPPGSPRRSSRIAQVTSLTLKSDPKPSTPRRRRASVGSVEEDSAPIRKRRSSVDKELPRKERKSSLSEPSLESIAETSLSKSKEKVEPPKEKPVTPKAVKKERKSISVAKFNLETINEANVGESPEKGVVEILKKKAQGKGSQDPSTIKKIPIVVMTEATPEKNIAKVLKESVPVEATVPVAEKEDVNSSMNSKESKVLKGDVAVEELASVAEKEDLNSSKNSNGSDKENIDFPTVVEAQTKRVSDVFRPRGIEYSSEEPMDVDMTIVEVESDSEVFADETKPVSSINENNTSVTNSPPSQVAKDNSLNEIVLENKQKSAEDTVPLIQLEESITDNIESKGVDDEEKLLDVQNRSASPEDTNSKQLSINLMRIEEVGEVLENDEKLANKTINLEDIDDGIKPIEELEMVKASEQTPEQSTDIERVDPKRKSSLHAQQNEEMKELEQSTEVEIVEQSPQIEPTESKRNSLNENMQNEPTGSKRNSLNENMQNEPTESKRNSLNENISEINEKIESVAQSEEIPKPIDNTGSIESHKQIENLNKSVEQLTNGEKHEEEQLEQIDGGEERKTPELLPSNANIEELKEPVESLEIEEKDEEEPSRKIEEDAKTSFVKIGSDNTENEVEKGEITKSQNDEVILELPPSDSKMSSFKRKSSDNSEIPNQQEKEKNLEEELPQSKDTMSPIKRKSSDYNDLIEQEQEKSHEEQPSQHKVEQEIQELPASNDTSPMKRRISYRKEVNSPSSDNEEHFELKISAEDSVPGSPLEKEINGDDAGSVQVLEKLYFRSETIKEVENAVSNEDKAAPEVVSEHVEIISIENSPVKPTETKEIDEVEVVPIKPPRKAKSLGHINFKSTTEILRDEKKDAKIQTEIIECVAGTSTAAVEPKTNKKKLPSSPGEENQVPLKKIKKDVPDSNAETKVIKRIRPTTIIRDNVSSAWFVEFDDSDLKPSTTNI